MQKKKSNLRFICVIIAIVLLLGLLGKSCSSSDSHTSGEIRCWYCSKVIYYNGRAIHCSHEYLNTYTCDYCGTQNVIK